MTGGVFFLESGGVWRAVMAGAAEEGKSPSFNSFVLHLLISRLYLSSPFHYVIKDPIIKQFP